MRLIWDLDPGALEVDVGEHLRGGATLKAWRLAAAGEMGAKDLQRRHLLLWPSLVRYHVPHSMDDECLQSPACHHSHCLLCSDCGCDDTFCFGHLTSTSLRPTPPCTYPAPQFIQSRLEPAMHRRAATAVPRELEEGGLNVQASARLHELGEAGSSRAQGWRGRGGELGAEGWCEQGRELLAEGWCGRQKKGPAPYEGWVAASRARAREASRRF
jgi:hypothetical protein